MVYQTIQEINWNRLWHFGQLKFRRLSINSGEGHLGVASVPRA
jgi:hypothetical protein